MRIALIERLATPAQVQRALGLLRRITEAGGEAPGIGELLVGEGTITEEQHARLMSRRTEVEGAITDAQSGLHEVPRRLGQYEVMERIGRGGMGAVYKARQLNMDRIVALKILAAHLTRDRKYIKQFIREARAAGQISHPNIVSVHEVGQAEGHFFICMEYVEGRTLSRELLARGRFKTGEVIDVARQVASGLQAAEKRKIVHRDIKPDNIILTPRGDIRVTDLGLAKRLADVTSASQSGWGCGTPYYMAPEQARNSSKVDIRADIYALGATLYHLSTGKLPFEGPSSVEVLMRAASDRLIPPSVLCPDVPVALSDLIERMMSRDPDGRPASTLALLDEVETVARAVRSRQGSKRFSRRLRRQPSGGRLLGSAGPSGLIQTAAWSLAALAVISFVLFVAGRRKMPREEAPVINPTGSGNGGEEPPDVDVTEGHAAETKVVDTAAELRTRKAIGSILGAAASARGPEDLEKAMALYETHRDGAGRLINELESARQKLVARREALARADLERRAYLAVEALRWGRPSGALDVFAGLEGRWQGTISAEQVKAVRARQTRDAGALVERLDARFRALAAAERFKRAGLLLGAVREGLFAPCQKWKAAARKGLEERRKNAAAELAEIRSAAQAVDRILGDAQARMRRWDFLGARSYLRVEAGKLPVGSRGRCRLELAAERARLLLAHRGRLIKEINAAKTPISDGTFRARGKAKGLVISKAHPGGLEMIVKDNPQVTTWVKWRDLGSGELLSLAGLAFSRRSGEDHLGMARLHICFGNTSEAEKYLRAAATMPGTERGVAALSEEMGLLASPDDEAAAEKLERGIREQLAEGRPGEAFAALGRLLHDYRRTAYVAARRKTLLLLLAEAQRDCVLAGPFAGKVREILPGCLRIEYDFARDRSRRDWRLAKKEDQGLVRLNWSPVFSGEFSVDFELSGKDIARASLLLAPVTRPGTEKEPKAIALEAGGPLRGGAELFPAAESEKVKREVGKLELDLVGFALYWGTPTFWGRSRLPADLRDALASEKATGWRLALEMPAGLDARVSGAKVFCCITEDRMGDMRDMRRQGARVRLSSAKKLPEAWMRAKDFARAASDYRDVPELAARAEVAHAAALVESGRVSEAAEALGRFKVLYSGETDLLPRVQELLDAIGKAGNGRSAIRSGKADF